VYSLKNPAYPEYVCKAHCGVMAVDVHPKHPHMLAVALSDGNVAIYNLQKSNEKPAYISTARNGKHQDIAWQVRYSNIRTKLLSFLNDGAKRSKHSNYVDISQ
jgi:dynein intermediate chain 1